ncbi:MAG: flavodoxin domain-containing protein [Dehalococcoidales bacterium]|nr:flavodoxin domain-containing protein [Dehalococcoidales bacterium]
MKTAIVFKSTFGASRQYAEWLHEAIPSDLFPVKFVDVETIRRYDTIVVCGGTYAGILAFNGFLKKHQASLIAKKLVLVAVGIAPPDDKASVASYQTIPEQIRRIAGYYKLPGKIGKDKTGAVNKENLRPVIGYIEKSLTGTIILKEVARHEKGFNVDASYRILHHAA